MLMMAQMDEWTLIFASADRPAGRTACRSSDECG
jgi:hypothetical protein